MRERQRQSGGAEDQSVLFFSCVGLVFFLQIFIRHNPKKERKKEKQIIIQYRLNIIQSFIILDIDQIIFFFFNFPFPFLLNLTLHTFIFYFFKYRLDS